MDFMERVDVDETLEDIFHDVPNMRRSQSRRQINSQIWKMCVDFGGPLVALNEGFQIKSTKLHIDIKKRSVEKRSVSIYFNDTVVEAVLDGVFVKSFDDT
jgi:hypothetical protein